MSWAPQVQRVKKKGRTPFYRLRLQGVEHHLGTDPVQAYRMAQDIFREAGGTPVDETPYRVADLVRLWRSEKPGDFFVQVSDPWVKWTGQTALDQLGRDHLDRFLRHLTAYRFARGKEATPSRQLSAGSIQKYVRYAHRILKWGQRREWLTTIPPVPDLPRCANQPRDIRPDQLGKVLESLQPRAAVILRFIAATGCRPSEACRLTWPEVNLRGAVCELNEHKVAHRGRTRTVYLPPAAIAILKSLQEGVERHYEGPVFHNTRGEAYTAAGLRAILRKRGVRGAYQLRHTFAQNALEQGVGMEDVAKLLGHADLRTVQTYAQVRNHRALAAAKSLSASWTPRRSDDDDARGAKAAKNPKRRRARTKATGSKRGRTAGSAT